MLLGGNKNSKEGGDKKVETLPVKIKGGSYVCKCEIVVFLFFLFLLFVCVLLQKHYENRGFSQFLAFWGHFWVQHVGSISGPQLGQ